MILLHRATVVTAEKEGIGSILIDWENITDIIRRKAYTVR